MPELLDMEQQQCVFCGSDYYDSLDKMYCRGFCKSAVKEKQEKQEEQDFLKEVPLP